MALRIKRKSVYVPTDLWNILAEDANRNYHTVTGELTRILRDRYIERLPHGQSPSTFHPTTVKDNTYTTEDAKLRESENDF